jgi:tRNA pseudouridine55 synthase
MDGILLVDKPAGWTSFDVVAKVRGLLSKEAGRKVKVGHSGTLDPFAAGLLILLIGKYTKQSDQFLKLDKTYSATLILGRTSTTADPEGEITSVNDNEPSQEEVISTLNTFIGQISQTPPIYSAIKIDGQRAYKLARAGQKPVIEPRNVTIYGIRLIEYAYPELKIEAKVSSGTYIRSLAVDIGESLGVGAYLSELKRTNIAQFDLDKAINPEEISFESLLDRIHETVL